MSPEKAALLRAISALDRSSPDVLTERRGTVAYAARRAVTQDIDNLERVALQVADRFEEATAAQATKDGTILRLSTELAQKDAAMRDALQQKDAVIVAGEAALAEKSAIIAEKERALADKDRIIAVLTNEKDQMAGQCRDGSGKEKVPTWASFAHKYRWPAGAAFATAALWWYASRH